MESESSGVRDNDELFDTENELDLEAEKLLDHDILTVGVPDSESVVVPVADGDRVLEADML